jgi:imidazolonepropionase
VRADLLIRGASCVVTCDERPGDPLGLLSDAAVAVTGDAISWIGPLAQAPPAERRIDATGCVVLPGLVDCHTHLVWAGERAGEFERRLAGESYTSILEGGGGILSTVRATRTASEAQLRALATARLLDALARGITTVEVKSGYGLEPASEAKMLAAAHAAGREVGARVVGTFLGAHAVPSEWRHDRAGYVRDVIVAQLPAVLPYVEAIDAYVDRGAFTVEEGREILTAGREAGLHVRVHAEQVAYTGAAEMAASLGAISADHLERIDDAGIAAMAAAGTVAVLLPAAMLYLRDVAPPVARLRAAGVRMAVATDLNPGTSPSPDLWAAATLASVTLGLTVAEAIRGITCEAALALGHPELGRLRVGAPADVAVIRPPPGFPLTPAGLVQPLGGHRATAVVARGRVLVG